MPTEMKPNTCATCKHWEIDAKTLEYLNDPEVKDKWGDAHCQVLHETIDIEECASTGYGSGGHNGIESVETPWDFGCIKWETR